MNKECTLCNFYTDSTKPCKYYINLIDLREMCENGVLKDANCFQLLFGFKCGSFKKEDKVFDFNNFHITYKDWSNFITFLKNGLFYLELISENDLIMLTETCNKFGGIPFFDREFSKMLSYLNNEKTKKTRNVSKPQDDINNLFIWKVVTDTFLVAFNNNHPTFSYSGYYEKIDSVHTAFYYKKLKNL